jgi:hypothetical protein
MEYYHLSYLYSIPLPNSIYTLSCIFYYLKLAKPTPISRSQLNKKLLTYLLLSISATIALADRSPNAGPKADAECGAPGVIEFDLLANLLEDVTPDDMGKCRQHPLGRPAYPGARVLRQSFKVEVWSETPDDNK